MELFVDDTSNMKGSGSIIVLEGMHNLFIKKSLKFEFKDSNIQAKYEALIADVMSL